MECRGQVVTSGGDPSTGRRLSIFIRVKYILKYTNRHIRKNCPLIISLASAAAEGTEQAAPFKCKSGFNAEYQLEFSSPAQAQAVHSTTCGHIISIIHLLLHLVDLSTTEFIRFRVLFSQHRWLQKMFPGEDDIYSDHF